MAKSGERSLHMTERMCVIEFLFPETKRKRLFCVVNNASFNLFIF